MLHVFFILDITVAIADVLSEVPEQKALVCMRVINWRRVKLGNNFTCVLRKF